MHAGFATHKRPLGKAPSDARKHGRARWSAMLPAIDNSMLFANNEVAPVVLEQGVCQSISAAREGMHSWLQCEDCKKLRLVDQNCFVTVDPRKSNVSKARTDDAYKWGDWIAGAPGHYAACQARHGLMRSAFGGGCTSDDCDAVGVFSEVCSRHDCSTGAGSRCDTSEMGSADEGFRADVSAELRATVGSFGARSGGLRSADRNALRCLSFRGASRDVEHGVPNVFGCGHVAGPVGQIDVFFFAVAWSWRSMGKLTATIQL